MRWRTSPLVLAFGSLSVLALAGCVQLMAPSRVLEQRSTIGSSAFDQASSLFHPLDIGNHWEYQNEFSYRLIPTGGPPGEPSVERWVLDVDVTGTEERFGREYKVQRESDGQGYEANYLYRQDKSGLYNADPVTVQAGRMTRAVDPAAFVARSLPNASESVRNAYRAALSRLMEKQSAIRQAALQGRLTPMSSVQAADGPLAGEIAVLRYPLAPSKTWHVREDPLFVKTVESQEGLDLPAGSFNGWRIRIDSVFFGPDDRVHVWHGRDGLLQLEAHLEGVATDENGNVVGTIVSDELHQLSEVSLVGISGS